MGVRISWLMVARNSDLSRLDSKAASRAAFSSCSAARRRVMSLAMTAMPRMFPSSRMGETVTDTGMTAPSLAQVFGFEAHGLAAFEELLDHLVVAVRAVRRQQEPRVAAHRLLSRVAVLLSPRPGSSW